MQRREFIAVIGGAAAVWPFAGHTQQPAKVHRVAFIAAASPISALVGADPISPAVRAFVQGLRDLGYIDGKNLILEMRSAEGRFERSPDIIREVVSLKVDAIITTTGAITRAAKEITQTVPIIMISGNPVEEGLVQSLARPGGNVTGLTPVTSLENITKRVEIIKEIVPAMSRFAHLHSKAEMLAEQEQIAQLISRKFGVAFLFAEHTPSDYTGAFSFIERERLDALLVAASAANYGNRDLIVQFTAKNRLPAIYPERQYAVDGGLIAYGADNTDIFRLLAGFVDRVLKGAKPADLPVGQPTKFPLTINLKTAKTLGLAIPPTLLARADEVIE
jgi:putative tryptophan/tyrosine transport system substrate-binding protein